jgi:hypothetical protein
MKANVSKKLLKEELDRIYGELYGQFAGDLTKSVTAAIFVVLATEYDFKKDDLEDLQRRIEQHFVFMEAPTFGKPYTTKVDEEWLRSNLGVDLSKSQLKMS